MQNEKKKKSFFSFNLVKHIMQIYGFYVRWWPAAISPLAPAVISLDLPARTGRGLLSTGCETSGASQVLPRAGRCFSRWPLPLWVSTHGCLSTARPLCSRARGDRGEPQVCAQSSEHPHASQVQGKTLKVFRKATRENEQLITIAFLCSHLELPGESEWKGNLIADFTRFSHPQTYILTSTQQLIFILALLMQFITQYLASKLKGKKNYLSCNAVAL